MRPFRMLAGLLLLTASFSWAQAPPGPYPLLPTASYVGATASSTAGPTYDASKAIDGIPTTMWHTVMEGSPLPPPPYWFQIDLGTPHWVDGVRYSARQDTGYNGMLSSVRFATSIDGLTWLDMSAGNFRTGVRYAQTLRFPAQHARFVRVTMLSGRRETLCQRLRAGCVWGAGDGHDAQSRPSLTRQSRP